VLSDFGFESKMYLIVVNKSQNHIMICAANKGTVLCYMVARDRTEIMWKVGGVIVVVSSSSSSSSNSSSSSSSSSSASCSSASCCCSNSR
jgi:hypothetical protein